MHFAMQLREKQHKHSVDVIMKQQTDSQNTAARIQELEMRIKNLEEMVYQLQRPQLMYRRPSSNRYEKVTEYLDDVERRLVGIEDARTSSSNQ